MLSKSQRNFDGNLHISNHKPKNTSDSSIAITTSFGHDPCLQGQGRLNDHKLFIYERKVTNISGCITIKSFN